MGLFRRNDEPAPPAPEPEPVAPSPAPGAPGRCPSCDGFGYLDHIDLVNRLQSQHCPACGHSWETRFSDAGAHAEPAFDPLVDDGVHRRQR